MTDLPFFARRLADLRWEKHMTQLDLAEAAGVTAQAVYYLEAGRRAPSWATVQALAGALGVSTEEFRDPDRVV